MLFALLSFMWDIICEFLVILGSQSYAGVIINMIGSYVCVGAGFWLVGLTLRPFHWEIMKSQQFLEDFSLGLVNFFPVKIFQSSTQGTYTWQSLSGSGVREGVWQRALLLTSGLTRNSSVFSQAAALCCCWNPWIWGCSASISLKKKTPGYGRDIVVWLCGIGRGSRVVISSYISFNQFPRI